LQDQVLQGGLLFQPFPDVARWGGVACKSRAVSAAACRRIGSGGWAGQKDVVVSHSDYKAMSADKDRKVVAGQGQDPV